MSTIEPKLVRYPFLPSAREKLNDFPLDDEIIGMLREPITDQALYRLTSAIRNANIKASMQKVRDFRYEPYDLRTKNAGFNPDVIEFYSFFTAIFASKDNSFLTNAFASTEATRAKSFFVNEELTEMIAVLREMVKLKLTLSEDKLSSMVPMMDYVQVATEYSLTKDERWKLVNLPLDAGIVYLSTNMIRDLFAALVQGFMRSRVRALGRAAVPSYVKPLVENLKPLIPQPPVTQHGQYRYIERLLEHRITDGRHRVIWLILAPYFVTVKGMDEGSAVDAVLAYIGETKYRQFVTYNVRRAVRNGLLPPSEQSLRSKHPDILQLLPKEVIRDEIVKRKQR